MDDESSGTVVKLLIRGRKRYRIKLYTSEPEKKKIRKVLHEGVLVEILSKLPAKSVLRFRRVSKEWYALTKTSYFIARHDLHRRSRSAQNHGLLLVSTYLTNEKSDRLLMMSLHPDDKESKILPTSFLPIPKQITLSRSKHLHFGCVGSSNGLVCCLLLPIENENEKENRKTAEMEEEEEGDVEEKDAAPAYTDILVVWNPATEEFRCLPQPPINPFEKEEGIGIDIQRDRHRNYVLGFDFLPEISQYKVVRVFPTPHPGNDPDSDYDADGKVSIFQAQVLLQSTNSWRDVKDKLEFPSFKSTCRTCDAITLNGVMYWLVEQTSSEFYLVSFNLRDEVFHLIPLPIEWRRLNDDQYCLHPWNGSAAILTSYSENGDWERVLWVLVQDQKFKKPAWVQQFRTRSKVFSELRCVGAWKDQYIVSKRSRNSLFAYDPRSDTKIKLFPHRDKICFSEGLDYVESLLPV
ncbi:F-box/kelch-repeat protein At3g17530-like [Prunus avium]|uniref:F-box/kelch-repeat protein At3g17530-like n=1 Tax=Prunus avium TaxID=42229 RepID=A0A6P5TEW5_PRUAV|nr:F-box/kelch-repeat protein At3g17530-like [Prunus avium]